MLTLHSLVTIVLFPASLNSVLTYTQRSRMAFAILYVAYFLIQS